MPSRSQVREVVGNKLWHAAVVALPVLLLSVAHSAALVKRLACSHCSHCAFHFSHLAAVAHKTLPVKGSAPELAQVWHGVVTGLEAAQGIPEEQPVRALPT